jgi:hypothetical protein
VQKLVLAGFILTYNFKILILFYTIRNLNMYGFAFAIHRVVSRNPQLNVRISMGKSAVSLAVVQGLLSSYSLYCM